MKSATGIVLVAAALLAGCGQGGAGGGSAMTRLFGAKPEALVRDMFESPDPDARRQAIEKLSSHDWGLRDPYLKGYSLKAQDESATVRSAAIRALGKAGDTRYAAVVIAALGDRAPAVRGDAAVALDWMPSPDPGAPGPLMQSAAKDESLDVRMNSCRALRHYPRRDVLETLLAAMDDSDLGVRFQAARSLKEMTGEDGGTDSAVWRDRLGKRPDPFVWRKVERRPWWDWFGVTGKPSPPPTVRPPASATPTAPAPTATQPAAPPGPAPGTRPARPVPAATAPTTTATFSVPSMVSVTTVPAPATRPAPVVLDLRPRGMNQPPPLTPPSTLVPREPPPEPPVVDLTPKATTSTARAAPATRPVITPDPSVSISVATHPAATVRPVLTPAQSPPTTQPASQPSATTTSTAPAPQYPIILKFPPPGKPAATQPGRWWEK